MRERNERMRKKTPQNTSHLDNKGNKVKYANNIWTVTLKQI